MQAGHNRSLTPIIATGVLPFALGAALRAFKIAPRDFVAGMTAFFFPCDELKDRCFTSGFLPDNRGPAPIALK